MKNLIVFILLIMLSSCSDKDQELVVIAEPTTTADEPLRIASIARQGYNQLFDTYHSSLIEYHYEGNKLVKITYYSSGKSLLFDYTGDQLTKRSRYDYVEDEITSVDSFVYNNQNLLIEKHSYGFNDDGSPDYRKRTNYFYNSDNVMTEQLLYRLPEDILDNRAQYYYENGNVRSTKVYYGEQLNHTFVYSYDDKNRYLNLDINSIDKPYNINNTIIAQPNDHTGFNDNLTYSSATYEYNEQDYPVKIYSHIGSFSFGSVLDTATIVYQ